MPIINNEKQNKKILTLESPVEYKHTSKKSMIVQKEVGPGRDCLCYSDGVKNSLREDCDIIVVGEIRDRETMDAAIETAEAGHLVIGTLHTKSCAETIDRMINFYDMSDQQNIKYLVASYIPCSSYDLTISYHNSHCHQKPLCQEEYPHFQSFPL